MSLFPQFKQEPPETKWVKAICVIADLFTVGDDSWPTEFRIAPREGDFVESNQGRRLKVIRVTHKIGNESPVLELELGRDVTSVTPTNSSGGAGVVTE